MLTIIFISAAPRLMANKLRPPRSRPATGGGGGNRWLAGSLARECPFGQATSGGMRDELRAQLFTQLLLVVAGAAAAL